MATDLNTVSFPTWLPMTFSLLELKLKPFAKTKRKQSTSTTFHVFRFSNFVCKLFSKPSGYLKRNRLANVDFSEVWFKGICALSREKLKFGDLSLIWHDQIARRRQDVQFKIHYISNQTFQSVRTPWQYVKASELLSLTVNENNRFFLRSMKHKNAAFDLSSFSIPTEA